MYTSDLPPVPVGGTTVPAVIIEACHAHRDRVALVDDTTGHTLTYADLAHHIDRIGAGVIDRGLGRGDVVAIWAPNEPAWLSAALGAMAAGCAVTGISPLATDPEVMHHLRAAGARLLITSPSLLSRVPALAADSEVEEVVVLGPSADGEATPLDRLLAGNGASPDLDAVVESDVALLPFSSGTTGLSKGVELTHRNLVTMLRQTTATLPIGPDDAALALPPFPYVMGMVLTGLWPLCEGASAVTAPRFDPERFVPCIAERQLTLVIAPAMLAGFLAGHPAATPEALASVRLLGFGGAPTPPELHRAVADRFPGTVVGQGYGMTELTCLITVARFDDPGPIGSVGRLVANTELRVVDPVTGADRAAGETGELWIRGPQVMAGYRDRPEETVATVDADGWVHSGDLGRIDEAGYVYVVDRIKDLIKVKGYQVPPAELEQVLIGHPAVSDAAVTGVDVGADQRPVGFVVATPGSEPDSDEIAAWVADRVAPYKRLQQVHIVERLPRNPYGKVVRRRLAAERVVEAAA